MDLLQEILKNDLPVPQANANNSNTSTAVQVIDVVPDVSHLANNTVSKDASESRGNIRQLLAQGTMAVNDLMIVAKTTNAPRAYEVLANLLKTVAELNHDLMQVHAEEQSLVSPDDKTGDINIDKAVFVGSTSELAEIMKQEKIKIKALKHVDSSQHNEEEKEGN